MSTARKWARARARRLPAIVVLATLTFGTTSAAHTPAALNAHSPARHEMLGAERLGRWSRSTAKFPADGSPENQALFEQAIRDHPQFRGL